MTTDSLAHASNRYDYDAYGTAYTGSFNGRNKIGYNGKQYDSGTGWYNYGFRDYNPQTGRFTTQDPIRDGLNWWNYCNGNPLVFTDDDGAGGFGHSGMYVTGEDGKYYTFEVIGVGDRSNNRIPISNDKGTTLKDAEGLDTTILSSITNNSFPSPELSEKMNKSGQAACLLRVFDNATEMEAGLMKLGFDNCITFDTTHEQDAVILNAALSKGSDFTNYHLLSNSCGGWARDVLCTNGSGIKSINPYVNIQHIGSSAIPKTIGTNLLLANPNARYREFGKK